VALGLKSATLEIKEAPGDPNCETIVDDVILGADNPWDLILYFLCVIEVLEKYRVTVKLQKCRFMHQKVEFVGFDVLPEGNSPARSKEAAFQQCTYPETVTDLRAFISFLGFYQEHLPNYEVRIKPFRTLLKKVPGPSAITREEEVAIITERWSPVHAALFDELKAEILLFPVCARPDPSKRFYLRTDWASVGRGAVLAQPGNDPVAIEAMTKEIAGGPCEFDMSRNPKLRLRPIAFISKRVTTATEAALASTLGEAGTGVWAIGKFTFYLWGTEFTWICDCHNLKQFIETQDLPTHQAQRWRMFLLRFHFTIIHRSNKMMIDCDFLTRYNNMTELWRRNDANKKIQEKSATHPDKTSNTNINKPAGGKTKNLLTTFLRSTSQTLPPFTFTPPEVHGPNNLDSTVLARNLVPTRIAWTLNDSGEWENWAAEAGIQLVIQSKCQSSLPRFHVNSVHAVTEKALRENNCYQLDWLIIELPQDATKEELFEFTTLVHVAINAQHVQSIIVLRAISASNPPPIQISIVVGRLYTSPTLR
jgi:RNase H-like domain found in reverse transcriptase